MTDTFGMFVRGARKYLIDLLRDVCRGLLIELADLDPVRHQQVLVQLNEAVLFGQKGDKITLALKPEDRAERLQQVVNAALDLHTHLLSLLHEAPAPSSEAEAKLRLWLAALAKIIADETTITPDPEQPNKRRVVERVHGKKGTYRIACANDLKATYRDHGKGQAELQHNATLLTSDRFVHQTLVVTGSAPDPTTLPPLLENLHDHHDFFPPKVAGDQIYGSGKTRAEVAAVSQGQTQLIALVPDYEKRTDRFVPADFTLSEDGFSLTCPGGVTSTKIYFLHRRLLVRIWGNFCPTPRREMAYSESIFNKSFVVKLKGAFTMNTLQFKSALPIGLLGTALAVTTLLGNGQPSLSRAMEAMTPFNRPAAHLTAGAAYSAGALLEGRNHFVYYVTTTGSRQPIYDHDTLTAFGLQSRIVVEVDEAALANLPAADPLTRLVEDERGNLYWAAQGQLWQVNEWRPIVEAEAYRGLPLSRMDTSLAGTLPIHEGLPDGAFLRQGEQLYYFSGGSLITAPAGSEAMGALDIPTDVLALYPQKTLDTLRTRLNAETYLANIRRGPGLEYEVLGTVSQQEEIVATGRANSYWLQVNWQGQTGWLAGDLIKDSALLKLLPVVNPDAVAPASAPETPTAQAAPAATVSEGQAEIGVQLVHNGTWPVVAGLWAGQPADRAGMKIGDFLTDLNGENLSGVSLSQITERLRGQAGSGVTLKVFRPSANQSLEFTVSRADFNPATNLLLCEADPIRGFGTAWRNHPEVRPLLGCAFTNFRKDEHATRAAVQTFEHGWMLWLETDTVLNVDPIYVFYEDNGSYLRFGDQVLTDAHKYAPTDPGFFKVGDRFAKVYWEYIGKEGRARLGRATNEARDSKGAFQEFVNGRMFWAGESDTIYVIYRGYYDFDRDGQQTWQQGWTSFEDKFEDGSNK